MSKSSSLSFGPEWMRTKPASIPKSMAASNSAGAEAGTGSSSGAGASVGAGAGSGTGVGTNIISGTDTGAGSGISPVGSGYSTNAGSNLSSKPKIPWSGVAAGIVPQQNSSSAGLHGSLVFPNAAALSSSRAGSRSANTTNAGSSLLSRTSPHVPRSNNDEDRERSHQQYIHHHQQRQETHIYSQMPPIENSSTKAIPVYPTIPTEIRQNSGGKKYTAEEMLHVWEEMKSSNQIAAFTEPRTDIYYSIIPNNPASVEAKSRQQQVLPQQLPQQLSHQLPETAAPQPLHNPLSRRVGHFNFLDPELEPKLPGVTDSNWSPFGSTSLDNSISSSSILPKPVTSDVYIPPVHSPYHSSTPPPPGIASPKPPQLVNPDKISWIYKDPSGNEQGPFEGPLMQHWYSTNWLQESLLIRRVEETDFILLRDFIVKVGNAQEPFLVPLPPVKASLGLTGPSTSTSTGYFDDFRRTQDDPKQRELLRQQQLHQQLASLQLQQGNAAWGSMTSMSPISTPRSPMSPWSQHQQMNPISTSSSVFDISNLGGSSTLAAAPTSEERLWKRPLEPAGSMAVAEDQDQDSLKLNSESDAVVFNGEETIVPAAIEPPKEDQTPRADISELRESKESKLENEETPSSKVAPTSSEDVSSRADLPPSPAPVAAPVLPETAPVTATVTAPALAPWAKKDSKPKQLSLKEIQELEAAERRTKAIQKQQANILQAAKAAANAPNHPSVLSRAATTPSLPSGATWASNSSTYSAPKKTLVQIQKEEEEAAKRKALVSGPQTGRRYADIAAPKSGLPSNNRVVSTSAVPKALSSANSSSVPSDTTVTGEWTTVGPGGKKMVPAEIPKPPSRTMSYAAAGNAAAGRTVSQPLASQPTASPVAKAPSSAGEEFLQWIKTSLKALNAGVNSTELISMLLSLPANSDSKEIIADTIYSNSSTMDGRRFAEEFLRRRNAIDSDTSSSETWSEVLLRQTSSPSKPVNDGWNVSFRVVGKKNRRE